jgi:hypothetical protein
VRLARRVPAAGVVKAAQVVPDARRRRLVRADQPQGLPVDGFGFVEAAAGGVEQVGRGQRVSDSLWLCVSPGSPTRSSTDVSLLSMVRSLTRARPAWEGDWFLGDPGIPGSPTGANAGV